MNASSCLPYTSCEERKNHSGLAPPLALPHPPVIQGCMGMVCGERSGTHTCNVCVVAS